MSSRDVTGSHTDRASIPYEWVKGGQCLACGTPFEGLHLASKQTCDAKCRKQLQRERAEVEQAFTIASGELNKLRKSIFRGERVAKSIEELKVLKAEIEALLAE